METNEFYELINSFALNSKDVIRYSSKYQSRVETLSDHITEVMMMSYLISLNMLSKYEVDLDIGQVLEYALTHDLEEVITGDVTRDLKYYDAGVLRELRRVADTVGSDYLVKINPRVYDSWKKSKSGLSGQIVKIADILCVARKCLNEVEILGNKNFLRVAIESREYLKELRDDKDTQYSYLKDLIEGAYEAIDQLVIDNQDQYNKYKFLRSKLVKSTDN